MVLLPVALVVGGAMFVMYLLGGRGEAGPAVQVRQWLGEAARCSPMVPGRRPAVTTTLRKELQWSKVAEAEGVSLWAGAPGGPAGPPPLGVRYVTLPAVAGQAHAGGCAFALAGDVEAIRRADPRSLRERWVRVEAIEAGPAPQNQRPKVPPPPPRDPAPRPRIPAPVVPTQSAAASHTLGIPLPGVRPQKAVGVAAQITSTAEVIRQAAAQMEAQKGGGGGQQPTAGNAFTQMLASIPTAIAQAGAKNTASGKLSDVRGHEDALSSLLGLTGPAALEAAGAGAQTRDAASELRREARLLEQTYFGDVNNTATGKLTDVQGGRGDAGTEPGR